MAKNKQSISIDSEIYYNDWNTINQIGLNAKTNGINRCGYGNEDFKARQWFLNKSKEYGFKTFQDSVGNVFARYGPDDGPCIMTGSHIDSVPEGGKYDGILGVMAALECCRVMKSKNIQPNIAIEVVGTAEEEGRFGGMLGSQAISGVVDEEWLYNAKDNDGITLKDAMKNQNLDISNYHKCKRNDVIQFIELHIEQGPLLEKTNKKLGIVTGISGTMNPIYCIKGEANHSGTTPMELRKDPILAFSYVGSKIEDIIHKYGSRNARITIGRIDVEPNFAHTIPGLVRFTMNIRDDDNIKMNEMNKQIELLIKEAVIKYNCEYSRDDSLGSLSAVSLDSNLTTMLKEEAEKLEHQVKNGSYHIDNFNKPPRNHVFGSIIGDSTGNNSSNNSNNLIQVMSSGAGHDAQNFQQICPSAMIFIPSINGISHSPEEYTEWDDCLLGTQLLCNILYRLCMQDKA